MQEVPKDKVLIIPHFNLLLLLYLKVLFFETIILSNGILPWENALCKLDL